MKVPSKVFTVEEANALIPVIEDKVSRLFEKKEAYAKLHDMLFMHELLTQAERHGNATQENVNLEEEFQELESAVSQLERDIRDINQLGCIVRNVERGWVDFPAYLDGELVYFCWCRGEKAIQFYHSQECKQNERLPLVA